MIPNKDTRVIKKLPKNVFLKEVLEQGDLSLLDNARICIKSVKDYEITDYIFNVIYRGSVKKIKELYEKGNVSLSQMKELDLYEDDKLFFDILKKISNRYKENLKKLTDKDIIIMFNLYRDLKEKDKYQLNNLSIGGERIDVMLFSRMIDYYFITSDVKALQTIENNLDMIDNNKKAKLLEYASQSLNQLTQDTLDFLDGSVNITNRLTGFSRIINFTLLNDQMCNEILESFLKDMDLTKMRQRYENKLLESHSQQEKIYSISNDAKKIFDTYIERLHYIIEHLDYISLSKNIKKDIDIQSLNKHKNKSKL